MYRDTIVLLFFIGILFGCSQVPSLQLSVHGVKKNDTAGLSGESIASEDIRDAIKHNNHELLEEWLTSKKISSSNINSALMTAAKHGHQAIVKRLLEHGAKVDEKDNQKG